MRKLRDTAARHDRVEQQPRESMSVEATQPIKPTGGQRLPDQQETPRCENGSSRRVLRVITRLNIGGPAQAAVYLHRHMPDMGWTHHLIAGAETESEGSIDQTEEGVTKIDSLRRALDPRFDLGAYRRIARFVTAWRPDVVHTHMAKAGALGRTAATRAHTPVIVHTFHGHVLDGYFSRPMARSFVEAERRLARRTHALLAVSPRIRDELLALGIGRPDQWHVVPVGVQLAPLLERPPERATSRRELGLPLTGALVGIVGRLVPIKDHHTFLAAAARVARERPDVTFVVAGDGELRSELEAVAAELLGDRVRFLGWVHDLPALYAALDIVVLTSRNEGTPYSLIEAGAAEKAVIATRVGGVSDVVADGRTGLLVRAADPEAIGAAVSKLLDDTGLAAAMGGLARQTVRERYSAERLLQDLSALYDDLLLRSSGRT
ncbi:MAG: glycosyltransferase [Actinomycetota bacterium]